MVKRIAVYGSYEAWVPVYQRYWKHRRDCIRQRYWKKTKRMKKVAGKGRDLYRAVVLAHKYVPKDYVTVSAEKFIKHPESYGFLGEWVEREVESL